MVPLEVGNDPMISQVTFLDLVKCVVGSAVSDALAKSGSNYVGISFWTGGQHDAADAGGAEVLP